MRLRAVQLLVLCQCFDPTNLVQ